MVKKKSTEHKSTVKEPETELEKTLVKIADPVLEIKPVPQADPAQELLKILEAQEQRQLKTEQQVSSLIAAVTNMGQHMDVQTEQKKAEAKPQNPADIIKTIVDILNGPIGNIIDKAIDSLGGGEPGVSAAPVMSAEEIKKYQELAAYRDGRMKRMDEMQESWMSEMVQSLKLKNLLTKKEFESDIT